MNDLKRRPLVAGNWKMNGLHESIVIFQAIEQGSAALSKHVDLLICPPATLLNYFSSQRKTTSLSIGAQNCHSMDSGAYTGDLSASMLRDSGAQYVIVGHSERRQYHHETDYDVHNKAAAAHKAGLIAIICIGETKEEREMGKAIDVVRSQLRGSLPEGSFGENTIIAYEPVWAIGTGLTPTVDDVAEVHSAIRTELSFLVGDAEYEKIKILYGGSVKPTNAKELLSIADVDGALVGGASLNAKDFLAIAESYISE